MRGQEKTLTVSEAAREIGVHPQTLRKWTREGRVPYIRLPSGYRKFTRAQIEEIKEMLYRETEAE